MSEDALDEVGRDLRSLPPASLTIVSISVGLENWPGEQHDSGVMRITFIC